ncbi:hypothetical protein [[Mycobacterium] holstebronense]|uniref:Terminase n=1 Tax=[Mycobacterium] holstebronense TaxID=3064288 RepID=A0ABM9LZD9_9MYCO|nr:hypothetical protein [Mycolicibacter sp. MU0102]CAJ1507387.1 hypothetical protein MU0102_003056 [Mycolicibacter sp. MU0102]
MPEKQAEIPKIPKGLKAAGRRFWRDIHATYEIVHAPEVSMLLEDAARTVDVVARLQEVVDNARTLRTPGSQKQDVAIPELSELRQYRAQFAALIKQLNLPDVAGEESPDGPMSRSDAGRLAAAKRWSHN